MYFLLLWTLHFADGTIYRHLPALGLITEARW
jgi:hypothetical protein